MVKRRACIGILGAMLLLVPSALRAADANPPGFIASLQLNDGRVLHNVKVMSNEATSIVVRADEGLLKVAKSNLPPAVANAFPAKAAAPAVPEPVMKPFYPDKAPAAAVPDPAVRPVSKPAPPGISTLKGCSIISFQKRPFQTSMGCAEVVIRNETDSPVEIYPGNIVCVTTTGDRLSGRTLVIDGAMPVIKRSERVPPHGDIDEIVTFTNEPLEISYVQWSR